MRIGIVWAFADMDWFPWMAIFFLSGKAGRRELARARGSNTLKLQQTIEAHAKAHRTCLKPIFESAILGLEVVPLLRLGAIPWDLFIPLGNTIGRATLTLAWISVRI